MPEDASLQRGAVVLGTLDFAGRQDLARLPKDLTIGGDLILRDTDLEVLPSGLQVGGDLDIEGSRIATLPPGLRVGGDLRLRITPGWSVTTRRQRG